MARREHDPFSQGTSSGQNVPPADARITPGGWKSLDDPASNRTRNQLIALGVALVVCVLFVTLNSREVKTRFIVFSVETPLWVGLFVSLALGAVVGWFLHVWVSRHRTGS
jgi:uncharacterized integral membrane protein